MTMTPPKRFQVYGERCCGTNFIIKLLERNFTDVEFTEDYGFKHWFTEKDLKIPDDVLVIHITRNFTDSLQSLHRQPWHVDEMLKGLDFSDFIRAEWKCVWNDEFWGVSPAHELWGKEMLHERDPDSGLNYANVVAMKTAKDLHWGSLRGRVRNFATLNYDTVAEDPKGMVEKLGRDFGTGISQDFLPIGTYKGSEGEKYEKKVYPRVSEEDLAFIERTVEAETERFYRVRKFIGPS